MKAIKFIKSFSKGQITIPKEIREELAIGDDFWLRIYVSQGKIVAEPVEKKKDLPHYVENLLNLDTSWFSQKDDQNYQKNRIQLAKRLERNDQ